MNNSIYFIAEEVIECKTQLSIERFYDYNGFILKSTFEIHGNDAICMN
jgi:hypothetical protein